MPAQTLLAVFHADWFTAYCRRHFDAMATLRVFGLGEFVTVWDPALIKELFTGDRELLRAGEANALLGSLGRSSVFVADGDRHLRLRRLLLPPFHGDAVRRYGELIREIALAEVDRWPVGGTVSGLERMRAIALEVILRAVIGVRDPERSARLRSVLPDVLDVSLIALLAENAHPRLFESRLGRRLGWLRARREAYRLLDEEIAAHRAEPDGREDILALLLQARDCEGRPLDGDDLRDQLFTLLVAGHETTAAALAWCLERLVRHPAALARLQREIASGGGDAYLSAVIDETLRVRPVLDQVMRRLAAPLELGGYRLGAGTLVAASIIGVQGSEAFDDPERFRPERFLDHPAPPYALIPFGGGARRCLGASFALLEMREVLRAVLQRVELRAPIASPERPTRWRRFTTVPARGARVIVATRPGTTTAGPRMPAGAEGRSGRWRSRRRT